MPETDPRIVYGATCVWWDTIDKVGRHVVSGLPACPICGGVLYEMENLEAWWASIDDYEAKGHSGYRAFMEWLQGKCFRSYREAYNAFAAVST